jgi:hypothetical protein
MILASLVPTISGSSLGQKRVKVGSKLGHLGLLNLSLNSNVSSTPLLKGSLLLTYPQCLE